MLDASLTLIGNLTEDPSLRVTPTGVTVASFRLAATARVYDRTAGAWRDGDSLFLTVNCWRGLAEHVANSLRRGHRAVVVGRLRQRDWTANDGTKRTSYEVAADAVGPELTRQEAVVTRIRANAPVLASVPSPDDPADGPAESPVPAQVPVPVG